MFFRRKRRPQGAHVGIVVLHHRCLETFADEREDLLVLGHLGTVEGGVGDGAEEEACPALELLFRAEKGTDVAGLVRSEVEDRIGAWSVLEVLIDAVEEPSTLAEVALCRQLVADGPPPPPATHGVPILVPRSAEAREPALEFLARTWSAPPDASADEDGAWYVEARVLQLGAGGLLDGSRGGIIGCWLRTPEPDVALWVARRVLRQEGYAVTQVLNSAPATREGQSESYAQQLDAAMKHGVAVAALSGPGADQAGFEITADEPAPSLRDAA